MVKVGDMIHTTDFLGGCQEVEIIDVRESDFKDRVVVEATVWFPRKGSENCLLTEFQEGIANGQDSWHPAEDCFRRVQ